jgi:murein DD-endopeptidase MepM/ murein hydrolase activator NlpD
VRFKIKEAASMAAVAITVFTLYNAVFTYDYKEIQPGVVKAETYEPSRSGFINMQNFSVPAKGTLTSKFGQRWGKMHNGIDIGAPSGTIIHSAASGVVSFSGWQQGYGYVIKIDHGSGIETVYAHCRKIYVSKCQKVAAGEDIGEVGSTGNSTGPHVHFEIRVNGTAKNPLVYIKQI